LTLLTGSGATVVGTVSVYGYNQWSGIKEI
jgi:hypothetical protein